MKKDKNFKLKEAIIASNKEVLRNFKPLDKDEKEIFERYKNEKIEDIVIRDDLLKNALTIQKEYKKQKKTDVLTLRVNHNIKEGVKIVADENGMNYQSFINMLLFKIANRELILKIQNI
jgi:predicted DNA binding CopG/RHH family protein